MKKNACLFSSVCISRTSASNTLHKIISILLLLVVFGIINSYAEAGIRQKQDISKIVQKADAIIRAKVVWTESQWKEDQRGRHIYTTVVVDIIDKIKGNIGDNVFSFEVVGGTVDDIREVVSGTPAFEIDEDAIMFLAGQPLTIKQGISSKILIYDGRVYRDDAEITVDSFIRALKVLEQDPNALVSLGEKYQTPTAGVAAVPNITSISPDKASAGTNTQVTITGTSFGSTQGTSKVWFFYCDGQPKIQASIVSWSNTQIVCKVPVGDVEGYPASAGSGPVTVTTSGGTSNGYDFKVTFGRSVYKWPGTSPIVSYKINQNTSDCTGEGAAVQAAASSWNNVGANFTFSYGGTHTHTTSSQNYVNEIMWGIAPDSIATTYYWISLSGTDMVECDIVFNDSEYDWSTATVPYSWEMDVQSVALHEFGHWLNLRDLYGDLGVCHEYDTDKVMYGYDYTSCGWESKRNLHRDDTAGICNIYGGCPPIIVVSPNGGESWQRGASYDITWSPGDKPSSSVMIDLYKGGVKDRTISLLGTPDDGVYTWTILLDQATGSDYKVKITSSSGSDYSNANFSITAPPSITVTSPNGGESWQQGTSHYITWSSSGSPGSYVKIELYKGGLFNSTITSSTSNDGSYYWSIPSGQTIGSDYKVKITSTSNSSYYDYSNNYFSIIEPPPDAPTGVLATDGTYTDKVQVSWNSSSGATSYEIWRYTSNNSGSASKIADDTASPYDDTNAVAGTTYWYWVKAKNSGGTSGFSNGDSGYRATIVIPPDAPVLHEEPNMTQGLCNMISWDTVPQAKDYYAECSSDPCFLVVDYNSGWITRTSYQFCGLTGCQEYWYRVKSGLSAWSQTSQAEFQSDTLIDTTATISGDAVLAGGGAPVVDTVGGTSSPLTTSSGYFNGFLVTTGTTLTQIEIYLGISTSMSIEFVVYEGGPSFSDQYNRIHSSTLDSSGTGTKFYASDPISVPLEAGKHYMIGAVWSGSVTTYYDSSDSSPTFADHTGWGSYSVFPSPNILSDVTIAVYTFYHRYTTVQSTSGYDSSGSIVSTPINLPAGGSWDVVDFNTTTPPDTELTVDVLPAAGSIPIPGYQNSSTGTDLSGISETIIRLRANLSTADANNTPALHDWSVAYTDPAGIESDWSNVESSIQVTPGDFEPDCDVDWDDLAVLTEQWLLVKLSADVWPDSGDGVVNFLDLAVFANAWQSMPSSPNWNPKCDIAPQNGDGIVDTNDLAVFTEQWLQFGVYNADIAPLPESDGMVNFLDFAAFADYWLEGQ